MPCANLFGVARKGKARKSRRRKKGKFFNKFSQLFTFYFNDELSIAIRIRKHCKSSSLPWHFTSIYLFIFFSLSSISPSLSPAFVWSINSGGKVELFLNHFVEMNMKSLLISPSYVLVQHGTTARVNDCISISGNTF